MVVQEKVLVAPSMCTTLGKSSTCVTCIHRLHAQLHVFRNLPCLPLHLHQSAPENAQSSKFQGPYLEDSGFHFHVMELQLDIDLIIVHILDANIVELALRDAYVA
jgi:hypothetical protein